MKKLQLQWHTEKRRVDDLIGYEKNPRQLNEQQLEALKRSIKKFNLVELPAIDKNNRIVAGHQNPK